MTGPVSLDGPLGTPTDWGRFDVPSLWAMASMEDSSDSWTQVWAWWRCRDALDAYRRHLTACRDGLADKWPPQRSPASAAFLGRVDGMIQRVADTADAAGSNAAALAGIINALDDAKHRLAPIHAQWQANEQAETAALAPRQVADWGATSPTVSGLPAGWRDHLNRQAQAIAGEMERAVFDRTQQFVIVDTSGIDDFRPVDGGGSPAPPGGRAVRPPVIPPLPDPVPPPMTGPALSGGPVTGPPSVPGPGGTPPRGGAPPEPRRGWMVSTPVGRVMARGGVIGGPPQDFESGVPPERPERSPGRVPGSGGTSGEPGRVIGAPRTPVNPTTRSPDASVSERPVPAERPPMNVIGGSYLPAGGVMPGRSEPERPAGRRVNPVGGVIGGSRPAPGGESYTAASGHTVSVSDPRSGTASARPRRP